MPVRDRDVPHKVLPASEVRKTLFESLRHFRECGAEADPIFFGPHREPAGVMLSYERYIRLLDILDEFVLAVQVRERDRADDGERLTLEQLIAEAEVDASDAGLE